MPRGVKRRSYENRGYDFKRGNIEIWFAAWGDRTSARGWKIREKVKRPPTQRELVNAREIRLGFRKPDGSVHYRTHSGGLDVLG